MSNHIIINLVLFQMRRGLEEGEILKEYHTM